MSNSSSMIRFTVPKLLTHPMLWGFVGFGSSIVGFSCYALTPSFHHLFGKFNLLKIIIYCVVSLLVSCLILFADKCRGFAKSFLVKAQVSFLILTLTSLYSFWEDRASEQENEEKGLGRILNLSSSGAFALMSLSLSRQLQLEFEVGMFNFFLGCFLVTLMKMNFKLAPVAAFFCFVLLNIRSRSDHLLEMRGRGGDSAETDHVDIESNSHNVAGQVSRDDRSAETEHEDTEYTSKESNSHNVAGQVLRDDKSAETEHEDTEYTSKESNFHNVSRQDLPGDESAETEHEDTEYTSIESNSHKVARQHLRHDKSAETEHEYTKHTSVRPPQSTRFRKKR